MTPRIRRQSSGLLPGVCCCAPSRKTSWKPATKRRIRSMRKPGRQIPALRRYTKVWPPSAVTAICGGRWPRWDSIASKYECAQERNRLLDKLCPPVKKLVQAIKSVGRRPRDGGDCGLARKTRHVRVHAVLYRAQD